MRIIRHVARTHEGPIAACLFCVEALLPPERAPRDPFLDRLSLLAHPAIAVQLQRGRGVTPHGP